MATGYFIRVGDKTTCGGTVLSGDPRHTLHGLATARNGDTVTCGKDGRVYRIAGGIPNYIIHGVHAAGTLHSRSTCPCNARLIASLPEATYWEEEARGGKAALITVPLAAVPSAKVKEPVQHAQSVKKPQPEPLPLPALIYQTKNHMDDYQAKDMHYGDLDTLALRNKFGIDVDNVSVKVNPWLLKRKNEAAELATPLSYAISGHDSGPQNSVSQNEAAALMFDEFRELAKVFSFQGEYRNVITEMITHMQENSGTPYSSPQLDKALKEQILNDHSENSSLQKIKDIISLYMNSEYSFYPLAYKNKFADEISNKAVLPKFDSEIDNTNGLVIAVHDTWATHITLESLEVDGDSYHAKVHYRIQDHFGLDDADVLNPVYREFRIFRLWFALQRWDKYGYKPFITEMNATIEISGRRGV